MTQQTFDVVVIGGGPGGYVAAIRAAQLGFSVACVDEWSNAEGKPSLGGTCLNVGCIPSKAMLESSENYHRVQHEFAAHGIKVGQVELDMATMQKRRASIVAQLTGGVSFLFRKNKVTSLHGHGRIAGRDGGQFVVEVEGPQPASVRATHLVLASGSVPRQLPGVTVDNVRVLDNAGALALAEVPGRLGVIGAGVIGLEMGSVWRRLGAEVTVLEAMPVFLAAADEQVAREAFKILTKEQGLDIQLGVKLGSVEATSKSVVVSWTDAAGESRKAEFDRLIVAVGRAPNTSGLGLDSIGLGVDERGAIAVDDRCCTSVPNVYAIGDVVRGPMLAHKASEEGVAVAETIAGQHGHVDLATIPWVLYTHPEIAWVGRGQQQLEKDGIAIRVWSFPFAANGRAKSLGTTSGFVKMIADATTDRLLGVHIIGPNASELIAEAVVAMEFGASSEDIARIVHAHPSLAEVTHEAALAVDRRALHI